MPDWGTKQPKAVDPLPFLKKVLPLGTELPTSIGSPSPSIVAKLMGGALPNSVATGWPELAQSWKTMQGEYPAETAAVPRISTMGPISKMIHGNADAVTGPFGTIHLNKDVIGRNGQDINDVLAHELTHVGQGPISGLIRKMFGDPTIENQAVNREAMRSKQQTVDTSNIPLRFRQNLNVKK